MIKSVNSKNLLGHVRGSGDIGTIGGNLEGPQVIHCGDYGNVKGGQNGTDPFLF